MKYSIGQHVRFRNREAIIADHHNGMYLLWDKTGKKELEVPEYPDDWIPEDQLTPLNKFSIKI